MTLADSKTTGGTIIVGADRPTRTALGGSYSRGSAEGLRRQ
jgi:hypothetical protein